MTIEARILQEGAYFEERGEKVDSIVCYVGQVVRGNIPGVGRVSMRDQSDELILESGGFVSVEREDGRNVDFPNDRYAYMLHANGAYIPFNGSVAAVTDGKAFVNFTHKRG